MLRAWKHQEVARYHRWIGLALTVPLLAWITSSQMLHYVGMTAPNGLQGIYELAPLNSVDVQLGSAEFSPSQIMARLREDLGLRRVFWLRLQAFGDRLAYLVKPTPFAPGMTFDASSGERLDPLDDRFLVQIAAEKLRETWPVAVRPADHEFHRDYAEDTVPASAVLMEGKQPSTLILSRHTGRTLRRIDSDASRFEWWYRNLHVLQWGPQMWAFTALLFGLALVVLWQTVSGGRLLWLRRHRRKGRSARQRAFQFHRCFAAVIVLFLGAQMLVGAYMWLNLGPFQGVFRGKPTFEPDWGGGIATDSQLVSAARVIRQVSGELGLNGQPIQWIEWRSRLDESVVIVSPVRNEVGRVFDSNGKPLPRLTPDEAGRTASRYIKGRPAFQFEEKTTYYWNDLNRKIPAYRFRFDDLRASDVFVCQTTGDVISRRTDFWRAFGPFLRFHSFAWTQNRVVDTGLLIAFQLGLLGLLATGWRLHLLYPAPARREHVE